MAETQTVKVQGNGIGFGTLLGIVFIVLKLTGVIDWPWIWVLAPIWIPWAILLVVLFGMVMAAVVVALLDKR